jgi:hypothetical protein
VRCFAPPDVVSTYALLLVKGTVRPPGCVIQECESAQRTACNDFGTATNRKSPQRRSYFQDLEEMHMVLVSGFLESLWE